MLEQTAPPSQTPKAVTPPRFRASGKQISIGAVALIISGIALWGIPKALHSAAPHSEQDTAAPTRVAVVAAVRKDLAEDIQISGEFYPLQEIALHAKVSGFLKSIRVDVGDSVKEGEKIAELEIPELQEDFAKAKSDLLGSQQEAERAAAEFTEAQTAWERLQGVAKANPKLVAQQEMDKAKARKEALQGALGGAQQRVLGCKSQLEKMQTLLGYAQITIPFDGVVTRRYADPGALIQAGMASSTQTLPLIELAEQDRLRLQFPVPESAVPRIRVGLPVEITVGALQETFRGTISRYAGKIDRNTRTMLTEVEVSNPEGRYKPGMYASVRLILKERKSALTVPIQAVVTGDNPSIYVLNNGVIEERQVSLGMQTPDQAEVLKGLKEGEMVIVGNRSNLHSGSKATEINLAAAN